MHYHNSAETLGVIECDYGMRGIQNAHHALYVYTFHIVAIPSRHNHALPTVPAVYEDQFQLHLLLSMLYC